MLPGELFKLSLSHIVFIYPINPKHGYLAGAKCPSSGRLSTNGVSVYFGGFRLFLLRFLSPTTIAAIHATPKMAASTE
jgi:hypothetical protein